MSHFMDEVHSRFGLGEEQVRQLLLEVSSELPRKLERIISGYDNEVYRAVYAASPDYYLRIRRRGEVSFRDEAWAMEQGRSRGVPVPAVISLGQTADVLGQADVEYMVLEGVSGQPLAELWAALGQKERETALFQAGIQLARIHSIKVSGFWRRQPAGDWDFDTWEGVMDSALHDRSGEKQWIQGDRFSEEQFSEMMQLLRLYRDRFGCSQPVLCHGDYLPEHIFVDASGHVTGIIDFGQFQGGPAELDVAYLRLEWPQLELTSFLAGFGSEQRLPDEFPMRLELQRLALAMGHLAYQRQEGDTEQTAFLEDQLADCLEQLRPLLSE